MEKNATDILTSKKFYSAIIGLIGMLAVAIVPELEQHIDTLVPSILIIIGVLIGGYTIQDNAKEKYSSTLPPSVES